MKTINQTISTVLSRTCCRSFNTRPVSDEKINLILKAAQAAPSAKNRQPWYFIVIKNQNLKKELAQAAAIGRRNQFKGWNKDETKQMIAGNSYLNSNDRIIAQAPVVILILRNSDTNYQEALTDELNIKEEQGVACAAFSIMLAAETLGLRSCWLCSALYLISDTSEVKISNPSEAKNLYINKLLVKYGVIWQPSWQPRAFIPIGYPAGKPIKPVRKKLACLYQLIY